MRLPARSSLLCVLLAATPPAHAADAVELSGDILRIVIPAGALALTYTEQDSEGRWDFAKAFGVTVGATALLKEVVDKDRPNGESQAFPSGHAATAFVGAAFIQRRYGGRWGVPAYVAASYVGWTRVETDNHEVEDVLGGAFLGVLSAWVFTTRRKEHIHVAPALAPDGLGLRVVARW